MSRGWQYRTRGGAGGRPAVLAGRGLGGEELSMLRNWKQALLAGRRVRESDENWDEITEPFGDHCRAFQAYYEMGRCGLPFKHVNDKF